jgi:hypothetical protein
MFYKVYGCRGKSEGLGKEKYCLFIIFPDICKEKTGGRYFRPESALLPDRYGDQRARVHQKIQ